MRTDLLRTLVADGAATIPGAKLWPNGIGFTARGWEFAVDETGADPVWWATWGKNAARTLSASGPTPEVARAAARRKPGHLAAVNGPAWWVND